MRCLKIFTSKTKTYTIISIFLFSFYFTDETRQCIEVLSLETLQRRVLVTNNVINPMSITVSPKHALIFWSDWRRESENSAVIRKADSNGENPQDLAFVELSKPTCLTVNSDRELIVWLDRELNTIEMIFFNGMNRKKLLKLEQNEGFNLYSLAWLDEVNTLFYSDPKSENIEKLFLNDQKNVEKSKNTENQEENSSTNTLIWGPQTRRIQAMTTITQKPAFRPEGSCEKCNSRKSICLPSSVQKYECYCPTGLTMTTNGCQQFPDRAIIYAVSNNIKRYSIFNEDSNEIGNNHAVSLFDRKNRLGLNEINGLGLVNDEKLVISDRQMGIFEVDLFVEMEIKIKKLFNFTKSVKSMSVDQWTGNVYRNHFKICV